jgi:hypothetical protein
MCVQYEKKRFASLEVKNKPRDGGTKHAFILGSMDFTVVNRYKPLSSVHK